MTKLNQLDLTRQQEADALAFQIQLAVAENGHLRYAPPNPEIDAALRDLIATVLLGDADNYPCHDWIAEALSRKAECAQLIRQSHDATLLQKEYDVLLERNVGLAKQVANQKESITSMAVALTNERARLCLLRDEQERGVDVPTPTPDAAQQAGWPAPTPTTVATVATYIIRTDDPHDGDDELMATDFNSPLDALRTLQDHFTPNVEGINRQYRIYALGPRHIPSTEILWEVGQ